MEKKHAMSKRLIPADYLMSCIAGFCLVFTACAATGISRSTPGDPLSMMIRFYEGPLDHLSAVRAGECPMFPSCSAYAKAAVQEYGLFTGWMMASDRLMRCGRDETRLSPPIFIDGKWKTYDPLEKNALILPGGGADAAEGGGEILQPDGLPASY